MKRKIIETRNFTKSLNSLLKKRQLLKEDFDSLKKELVQDPEVGDLIGGTGGVRKTRLKSASRGKSGGFRVCYYDLKEQALLFLILIYSKNEQKNLTLEEKNVLKELISILKGTKHE